MPQTQTSDQLVGTLRDTIVALVRRDGPDLSSRQLGVFLTCYLQDGAHTVRGLAAELYVSKPAITRALDRLGDRLGQLGMEMTRRRLQLLKPRTGEIASTTLLAFPMGAAALAAGALAIGAMVFSQSRGRGNRDRAPWRR